MKIQFTQRRELSGGRKVAPGDTLQAPQDAPEDLLQSYVDNGIADIQSTNEVTTDEL